MTDQRVPIAVEATMNGEKDQSRATALEKGPWVDCGSVGCCILEDSGAAWRLRPCRRIGELVKRGSRGWPTLRT